VGSRGRAAAPRGGDRPGRPGRVAERGRVRPPRVGAYDHIIVTWVSVRVPAKVNLQLAVGPLRPDGYHDLVTVFHAVSLSDEVTVAPADTGTDSVAVSGEGSSEVPADDDNLALRAVRALRAKTGIADNVQIRISKRIPVAAGMAGGSADAAGALVACDKLWGKGLSA